MGPNCRTCGSLSLSRRRRSRHDWTLLDHHRLGALCPYGWTPLVDSCQDAPLNLVQKLHIRLYVAKWLHLHTCSTPLQEERSKVVSFGLVHQCSQTFLGFITFIRTSCILSLHPLPCISPAFGALRSLNACLLHFVLSLPTIAGTHHHLPHLTPASYIIACNAL